MNEKLIFTDMNGKVLHTFDNRPNLEQIEDFLSVLTLIDQVRQIKGERREKVLSKIQWPTGIVTPYAVSEPVEPGGWKTDIIPPDIAAMRGLGLM